jgi:hypothetical protein
MTADAELLIEVEDDGFSFLLELLAASHVDSLVAVAGVAEALKHVPPASPTRLSEDKRSQVILTSSLEEEDVAWAEAGIATGDFHVEVAVRHIEGLAACLDVPEISGLLGVPINQVDAMFTDGLLIGRDYLGHTAAPAWLFDTSTSTGILPSAEQVVRADDRFLTWTFGSGLYQPQQQLRGRSVMTPVQWLDEGYGVGAVSDLLMAGELEDGNT